VPLSRRQTLFGGGTLFAAAWLGVHAFGHRPLAAVASPVLGSSSRRTLEAALEALLPDPGAAAAVAEGTDAFLASADPIQVEQLRLALVAIEHMGGWSPWQPRRFSRLARAERVLVLRSWERSAFGVKRQIFQALRRTAAFGYYADPGRWEALGYDGPWVHA
jgi:hypothetical protein